MRKGDWADTTSGWIFSIFAIIVAARNGTPLSTPFEFMGAAIVFGAIPYFFFGGLVSAGLRKLAGSGRNAAATASLPPDQRLLKEVRQRFESKSTEELRRIWQESDRRQWSEEALEAARQLLIERGERLSEGAVVTGGVPGRNASGGTA